MSALASLSFVHRYEAATRPGKAPLLLLHGTGGNEDDLLDLGRTLSPGAALLSPRGQVLENGRPRFFRRLAEGVFDEADVVRRAGELAGFVTASRDAYGLAQPIALGFSNGANIAAATLLLHPDVLAGAVLLRPMVPLKELPSTSLAGTPVLMLSGAMDPIVPVDDPKRLAGRLAMAGARVEHRILPTGHGLTRGDLELAGAWFDSLARNGANEREFVA
jgi:phospholipase/carboxylesterase